MTPPINGLIDAHGNDRELGYQFLADALERASVVVEERRAWRLCSPQKLDPLPCTGRRGRTVPGPVVDHVQREFTTLAPDRVSVTDITEPPAA